jgi:polyhydroxybutyrate depolymerase
MSIRTLIKKISLAVNVALFAIFLMSCSNGKILINGVTSRYSLHLPKGYKKHTMDVPLLFVLHGNPSKGWQMKAWTGINKTADKYGFMVVYPNGFNKRWPIDPENNSQAIKLILELIKEINANYRVNTKKIFLSGISGGGIFSFQLIEAMPQTFAGFCVVAGNLPRDLEITTAVPFLYIYGTADYLWNGRDNLLSANETLDNILTVNKCLSEPDIKPLPDINKKDGSTVTELIYKSETGTGVVFYRVENGGHHWPNSVFNANTFHKKPLGPLNKDLDTNEALWSFLSQYSLPSN